MKTIKQLSDNELSETIGCLYECIHNIESDYLHISDYLQTELKVLKNKYEKLVFEKNSREDEF